MTCPLCQLPLRWIKTCSQPTVDGVRYRIKECDNGHRIAQQKNGRWRLAKAGSGAEWKEPMALTIGPGWGYRVPTAQRGRPRAGSW